MLLYPNYRILKLYIKSKLITKIDMLDTSSINMRVSLLDIDPFMEMNNGRYLTIMDVGRINHGFRTGFNDDVVKYRLGFAVAASSIKYRHRLPIWKKFKMSSKIIGIDSKWFYWHHEFNSDDKITTAAVVRTGVLFKSKLIKTNDLEQLIGKEIKKIEVPEWVCAWIEADKLVPNIG